MDGDQRTDDAGHHGAGGRGALRPAGAWLALCLLLAWVLSAAPAGALGRDQVVAIPAINLQQVHRLLAEGGWQPGPYNPEDLTGIARALGRLQRAKALPVTGRLDAATWAVLQGKKPPRTTRPKRQWPAGLLSALQGWLRGLGYRGVKPTGRLDAATRAALRAFRRREKLPAADGLDAATYLRVVARRFRRGCRLSIDLAAAGANPEAIGGEGQFTAKVKAPYARAAYLKLLALALTRQGYKTPATGRLDPGLRRSLRAFQAAQGLAVTGRPDGDSVQILFNLVCAEGCRFHVTLAPPGTAGPGPGIDPGDLSVVRKLHPSLSRLRRPVKPGETVLAIEKVQCSRHSGHWVLYYQGEVKAVEGRQVRVRVRKRFSYRYRADAQGINTKDWWCIPRRRHCYSPVRFNAWGGRAHAGEVLRFTAAKVFNYDIGVINAMMIYMSQQCKK